MGILDSTGECGIRFFCENYVDGADITVTEGVENIQFPKENLMNSATAKYFRSESTTTKIVLDLQQTAPISCIAIFGNKSGIFGISSASFKTSIGNDFTAATSYNIPLNAQSNMGYVFIDEVSHRYVEITMTGTGSYTELGRVLIGDHFYLPYNNLSIGSFGYGAKDKSVTSENTYGTKFIDKRPEVKTLTGSLEHCTKDEMDNLDDMFIAKGTHEPVFMVMDINGGSFIDSEYKTSVYGYLTSRPQWSASGGQLYTTTIAIDEIV